MPPLSVPLTRRITFAEEPAQSTVASSPFHIALDEYIKTRPKKSKTPQFILDLQKSGAHINRDHVQQAMVQLEKDSTDKVVARNIRKLLRPVITVLSDYSGVVDTLAQADPMPTAIIWGALKAVIESSKRFLGLYDTIKDQLSALGTHLSCLTEYEELFGHSETMQELLRASYIDVIRFWRRIEKECNRCVANRMSRALASFSTSKLDSIIASIGQNADNIHKIIPIVQERLQRGERENAAEERRLAGIARDMQGALYKMQLEELRLRNIERKNNRQKDVRQWLRAGSSPLNESNARHQEQNSRRSDGTCSWLSSNEIFQEWVNSKTLTSKLWLRAAPGVGKSFLCAYAIQQIIELHPTTCSIFQYYTFDDEFLAIGVFRAIAEQLADWLWTQIDDMPEEIHAYTQRSTNSSKCEDVKAVIRMMLDRISTTYIYLDGLDEHCDDGPRWGQLAEVLEFLVEITTERSASVRLWCSSQDRTCLQPKLENFSVIEVTKELNSDDIELYLSKRILELDEFDLDEGYQTLVLKDLRARADGCFLWASLMISSISKAVTLDIVQEQIRNGLPSDYEKYYQKKIESFDASQRVFVSKLLACIVYAKRPLRLDELCEAVAVLGTSDGQNIVQSQKLFKNQVLRLCEPLVQVQLVEGVEAPFSTCTLTHSSVRNYLIKNPQVLNSITPDAYQITEEAIANVCLRYLWQRRYDRLLIKKEDTFIDSDGENIMEHHLLSYSAKYWDKHLDEVPYTQELCERVMQFIASSQFHTCLQIQSLFVGGQFQFWLDSNRIWAGPHIRRVFPSWLSENCSRAVENDYRYFIGEWGYLLDEITNVMGKYPGEVDRCFWCALGLNNFLNKGRDRYKSFTFARDDGSQVAQPPARYYDSVNETGNCLVVLALENLADGSPELNFLCQQWGLDGRRPKLRGTQTLKVSRSSWSLYDYPLSAKVPGRPVPVSLTPDLQFLRIGSCLFSKSGEIYTPLQLLDVDNEYFEDIAGCGRFVAVSARQTVKREDLYNGGTTSDAIPDYDEFLAQILEETIKLGDQSLPTSTTVTSTVDTTTQRSQSSSLSSTSYSNSSVESLVVEEDDLIDTSAKLDEELELSQEDDSISDSNFRGNSAETSWSEGSTDHISDEIEDEDQWNDWGNDDLDTKEFETEDVYPDSDALGSDIDVQSQISEKSNDESSDNGLFTLDDGNKIRISGMLDLKLRMHANSSSDSVESKYSASSSGGSDEEDSDYENEGGRLEGLIFGGNKPAKTDRARRATIRIFDTTRKDPSPIFHFSQYVKRSLFGSPPVFHPSKPLAVWPLGSEEILFVSLETNTYFTRLLCCSGSQSCHVFIKCHFSSNGQYLHFAALEARIAEDDKTKEKSGVHLSLQVSTHRLSTRKTARSPPRLVFRTNIYLGRSLSISVSSLPYTLTWTAKELYVATRGRMLNVYRIPLFHSGPNNKSSVCSGQKDIFLPRTAELRNVRYFPPQTSGKRTKEDQGTVIIGSHSSIPSQGIVVPKYQVSPPIGFYFNESIDLGGWLCRDIPAVTGGSGDGGNRTGGCLKGKFETFNRNEDCDIVPYLF